MKLIKNNELTKVPVSHHTELIKEIILNNGEIPGLLQFARAKFKSGDEIEEHNHKSMYEIFYLIQGAIKIKNGEVEEIVSSGDTIVFSPGQSHSIKFINDTELIYFNLPDVK